MLDGPILGESSETVFSQSYGAQISVFSGYSQWAHIILEHLLQKKTVIHIWGTTVEISPCIQNSQA